MGLENKVKKLMKFGGALLLTFNLYCGKSNNEVNKNNPLINNVYYESNSFNNSLNRFFVTGEDITVYASLNEDADSAHISAKREVNNNLINENYDMNKDITGIYKGAIPKFDDAGVLEFKVIANKGKRTESSYNNAENIFISENDAHAIIRSFCDSKNTVLFENCYYNENESKDIGRIFEYDANFKKAEGLILSEDAIFEYVGENDLLIDAESEETFLLNAGKNFMYVYPMKYNSPYPLPYNELTTKQGLTNYISNFYYSL